VIPQETLVREKVSNGCFLDVADHLGTRWESNEVGADIAFAMAPQEAVHSE